MSEKTKVFNITKNITAILFSVAILVTGIIVVKRIAEIKQTTKMFQDGVELEDLGSYTDIEYDVVDGGVDKETDKEYDVDTIPGSEIKGVWEERAIGNVVMVPSSEVGTTTKICKKIVVTNSPLSFWKYSRAFFGYYVTSLIFSLVALKKLWRRSRKNAVMYGCYGVLSICEAIIAIYYAEGLWNYGMTRYVVWLAALCVLSAKMVYVCNMTKDQKCIENNSYRTEKNGKINIVPTKRLAPN